HMCSHFHSPALQVPNGYNGEGLLVSTLDHTKDLGFAEDDQLLAIELDVVAGVLAEEHLVTDLQRHGAELAVVQQLAFTHGNDLALVGLFLGAARQYDAAGGGLFFFLAANDHAVVQRTNVHLPILPKVQWVHVRVRPGTRCGRAPWSGVHRVALYLALPG